MGKIFAVTAGHGIHTPGKRCLATLDPNETREWWLNDRIVDNIIDLLKEYDCAVIRLDDPTGEKDISRTARAKAANNAKADAAIFIHHNAGVNGGSGGGTSVFYYSDSVMRKIQANDLYKAIVRETGLVGDRSQKVIKKGFTVLQKTNMPAFLVENGFMDSKTDVPIILTDRHAKKTAQGVVNFLVNEFDLEKKKTSENGSQGAQNGDDGEPTNEDRTYTVKNGDSLSRIGAKFGIDWREIAKINGIEKPYVIKPGQKLVLWNVYYPKYAGPKTTLINALKHVGVDSSYTYRKKIAAANNITMYIGSAAQNTQMYNLLVAGLLKIV